MIVVPVTIVREWYCTKKQFYVLALQTRSWCLDWVSWALMQAFASVITGLFVHFPSRPVPSLLPAQPVADQQAICARQRQILRLQCGHRLWGA